MSERSQWGPWWATAVSAERRRGTTTLAAATAVTPWQRFVRHPLFEARLVPMCLSYSVLVQHARLVHATDVTNHVLDVDVAADCLFVLRQRWDEADACVHPHRLLRYHWSTKQWTPFALLPKEWGRAQQVQGDGHGGCWMVARESGSEGAFLWTIWHVEGATGQASLVTRIPGVKSWGPGMHLYHAGGASSSSNMLLLRHAHAGNLHLFRTDEAGRAPCHQVLHTVFAQPILRLDQGTWVVAYETRDDANLTVTACLVQHTKRHQHAHAHLAAEPLRVMNTVGCEQRHVLAATFHPPTRTATVAYVNNRHVAHHKWHVVIACLSLDQPWFGWHERHVPLRVTDQQDNSRTVLKIDSQQAIVSCTVKHGGSDHAVQLRRMSWGFARLAKQAATHPVLPRKDPKPGSYISLVVL